MNPNSPDRSRSQAVLRALLLAGLLVLGAPAVSAQDAALPPEATHEVVCECECGNETQTYEWYPNFSCTRYEGIRCETSGGSEYSLSDCRKKAQKKDAAFQDLSRGASLNPGAGMGSGLGVSAESYDLEGVDIPSGDEYLAWLDEWGHATFGTRDFPGMLLADSPEAAGEKIGGQTAEGRQEFVLHVDAVDELETVPDYVDIESGESFEITFAWVRGSVTTTTAIEPVEALVTTATRHSNPRQRLTVVQPLGGLYVVGRGQSTAGLRVGSGFEPGASAPSDGAVACSEMAMRAGGEDACKKCERIANRDLERSKKTLKRCLTWKVGVVTVIGGIFGSAPGAILSGGVAAAACADAAIDRIDEITEDFCACLSKNDCPPHKWCKAKKDGSPR